MGRANGAQRTEPAGSAGISSVGGGVAGCSYSPRATVIFFAPADGWPTPTRTVRMPSL
jgi:hypothetical protein